MNKNGATKKRSQRKRRPPVGAPPGAMAVGAEALKPKIIIAEFLEGGLQYKEDATLGDIISLKDKENLKWIDIRGFGDAELLKEIGSIFSIHPLSLADAVNAPSRPKVEIYQEYVQVITAAVTTSEQQINSEQIGIFWGRNFVLTLQEKYDDTFVSIRKRLTEGRWATGRQAVDSLSVTLLDYLIDLFFPVLEVIGEQLEKLEEELIQAPAKDLLAKIFRIKRDLLLLRRIIWPQRELLNALIREPGNLVSNNVIIYLRDCYDHCVQIIDIVETDREFCAGFTDMYLSGLSNRLNEVMKVLTVISTIFMPLSFLAGVYGMNFQHFPELHWPWAYPAFWGVSLLIAGGMLIYFKRRGWLHL